MSSNQTNTKAKTEAKEGKKKEEKSSVGAATAPKARLLHPTLDDHHRYMLEGSTDRVKELDHIVVKFFPKGLQEVSYVMDNGGSQEEMTATQFNAFLKKKQLLNQQEGEVNAAKGFTIKLAKRCFVNVGSSELEDVRAIQAKTPPKAVSNAMGLTQAEATKLKWGDPKVVLEHWLKMPKEVKVAMDKYQEEVYPGAMPWTEFVLREQRDLHQKDEERLRKKHEKEAAKAAPPSTGIVPSGMTWADSEERKRGEEDRPKVNHHLESMTPSVMKDELKQLDLPDSLRDLTDKLVDDVEKTGGEDPIRAVKARLELSKIWETVLSFRKKASTDSTNV